MENAWQIGSLYPLVGGQGGFWTQPAGPYSPVFPQQQTNNTDILSSVPFNELTGQYMGVCGHSFNMCMVFREYDYDNETSVALLCCPSCGTVQRSIAPFSEAVGGDLQNMILYP